MNDMSLNIDGQKVRVRFVSNKTMGRLENDVHAAGGDYDRETRVIRVNTANTRNGMRSVLGHELGHHFVQREQLKVSSSTEEDVCDVVGWFVVALRDNPELVKYLTAP